MISDDFEIYAAARVVIRRPGDDAGLFIAARLTEFLEIGDADGQNFWLRNLAAVEQIRRREGETVH